MIEIYLVISVIVFIGASMRYFVLMKKKNNTMDILDYILTPIYYMAGSVLWLPLMFVLGTLIIKNK